MPLNADALKNSTNDRKTAELPNLNRPKPNTDSYHQQNMGAMNSAIALRAQETSNSLQRLHQQLEAFEDKFADAAVNRIDSVALRIEQKIAAKLNARHEARQQLELVDSVQVFEVPSFELPMAIAPSSAFGCLPM